MTDQTMSTREMVAQVEAIVGHDPDDTGLLRRIVDIARTDNPVVTVAEVVEIVREAVEDARREREHEERLIAPAIVIVEVPHTLPPRVWSARSLDALRSIVQEDNDVALATATLDELTRLLGEDLAAIDVWHGGNISVLAARAPSASRHGDPTRTLAAIESAIGCGLLEARS